MEILPPGSAYIPIERSCGFAGFTEATSNAGRSAAGCAAIGPSAINAGPDQSRYRHRLGNESHALIAAPVDRSSKKSNANENRGG